MLLLIGLFLNAFVSHIQRTLAVQIGGTYVRNMYVCAYGQTCLQLHTYVHTVLLGSTCVRIIYYSFCPKLMYSTQVLILNYSDSRDGPG